MQPTLTQQPRDYGHASLLWPDGSASAGNTEVLQVRNARRHAGGVQHRVQSASQKVQNNTTNVALYACS